MILKSILRVIICLLVLTVFSCKTDQVLDYPDIDGTWNVPLAIDGNTCSDEKIIKMVVVIKSGATKATGQASMYLATDTECPEWILNYTLTTDGKFSVNEPDAVWNPNICKQPPHLGTRGNISMNAEGGTSTEMHGTFSIILSNSIEQWECIQNGEWSAFKI